MIYDEKASYKNIKGNIMSSNFSIEDAHCYNDFTLFNKFKKTKIIIGLIKIASSIIETEEEILLRITEILKHIDKDRLIVAPDCGLGHLPKKLAILKLKRMVEAVKK